jgi:hypothetical protein
MRFLFSEGGEDTTLTDLLNGLALMDVPCRFNKAGDVVGGVLAMPVAPKLGLPGRLCRSMGVLALDRINGLLVDAGANPLALSFNLDVDDDTGRFLVEGGAVSSKTVLCSVFLASSSSRLSFSRVVADDDDCDSGPIDSFEVTSPTLCRLLDPA